MYAGRLAGRAAAVLSAGVHVGRRSSARSRSYRTRRTADKRPQACSLA